MNDQPDQKGRRENRPAGGDEMLPPMLLSLAGVLIAAALGIQMGMRLDQPPADVRAGLAGPFPLISGPGMLPPRGCGKGIILNRQCRAVDRSYLLYVPKKYSPERSHPLVVSLDGTQPSATAALRFARKWGRLADRYRHLVLAPELRTGHRDESRPAEATRNGEAEDLGGILAILDEVCADYQVDPGGVVLACWSRYGRLGHYLAVEHGNRLSAVAAMNASFSGQSLDASKAGRHAGRLAILIAPGPAEPPARHAESERAAEWYQGLGFQVQVSREAENCRTRANVAADFFEEVFDRRLPALRLVVSPERPAQVPTTVTVRSIVSSRVGRIRSYRWDFGTLASGVSHERMHDVNIRRPGTYPIKLTVTDHHDRSYSAQITLTIPPTR